MVPASRLRKVRDTPQRMNTAPIPKHPDATLDIAVREPLAVLLLGTDILRAHSGRLTHELLREQRDSMQRAASELEGALNPKPDQA